MNEVLKCLYLDAIQMVGIHLSNGFNVFTSFLFYLYVIFIRFLWVPNRRFLRRSKADAASWDIVCIIPCRIRIVDAETWMGHLD